MSKTRIKKKRGKYIPQYKSFFVWCNFTYTDLSRDGSEHNETGIYKFDTEQDALNFIEYKKSKSFKDSVSKNIKCRKDTDTF